MGLAWLVFATMTAKTFWLVRDCLGRPRELTRLEGVLSGIFLAAVAGGSVVTFDASLPWVYHEVYLWSMASVVGSLYWLLRVLRDPAPASIGWLFGFVLAASLTRTTGGWAVCIVTLLAAAWILSGRLHPGRRRAGLAVLAAAVIPWLAAATVNWLKFHHPFLFPLQDQVWTTLNAHRREALRVNGGSLFGPQFLPTSIVNYLRPDGVRFVDYFPWVTFPAEPARGYGATLDQSYRTGSLTSFSPLPLLLVLASVPLLLRPLPTQSLRSLRLVWFGGLLVTGGVMAYGYVAYRYTSEFVPLLIIGGAIATHSLGGWLAGRRRGWARLAVGGFVVLTVYGLLVNTAAGFYTAATTYRGAPLERYLGLQTDLSGSSAGFADLVHHSSGDPVGGHADDLWIRGNCDALFLNTGESAEHWVLVQERDAAVTIRTSTRPRRGRYLLMTSTSTKPRKVYLEVLNEHRARVVLSNEGGAYAASAFDLVPGVDIRVGARNLSELGYAEISSTPGGFSGYLSTSDWSKDWVSEPSHLEATPATGATVGGSGVTVTRAETLPLPLCQRIARASGATLAPSD